jgi:Tol biopolymer transport system component/DNA-binding winged helix-turn-helix (wHTH) protein
MALNERGLTYRFDSFAINTQDRVLLKNGETVTLAPKAADALLLLVSQPRRVLSKQEILASLWPDSFVEEGSVARNIAHLRKALADDAEQPHFIETLPKRGYRWIAEVDVADIASHPAAATPKLIYGWRGAWAALFACILLFLGVLAILRARSRLALTPEIHPFTTYRGGEYEPAFSPDGQKLAFVWNGEEQKYFDVYVRPIDSEDLTRLTSDLAGKGSPAWSRDGRLIAFLRYSEGSCCSGIYVVPAEGGPERKITSTFPFTAIYDRALDWSPVTDEIAMVDKDSAEEPLAIYIVSVKTGSRRRLTKPPAGRGDTGPAFSRDGRYVSFRRTISAAVNDIYIAPLSGGEPIRITFDNQYIPAHAWSADGGGLIFSSKRENRPGLWRVPASGGAPKLALAQYAQFLGISPAGDRLAYSQWSADTNIWRFDLTDSGANPAGPMIASTRADLSPQYSPKGDRVAFRSDRTGTDEIWICDADGRNPRVVTHWRGPLTGSPRWSPDSKRIAFDSRPGGSSQIFVVPESGGEPSQITVAAYDNTVPSWSHDGRFIYFASRRSGSREVWKVEAQPHRDADGAVQITRDGGSAAFESTDGRYVYYAKGENTNGLWRIPADGGHEEPVLPDLKKGLSGYWALCGDEILYVDSVGDAPADLFSVSLTSWRRTWLRRMPKGPIWTDSGLAVSPDRRWVLYAQADTNGSDIFLVSHFR